MLDAAAKALSQMFTAPFRTVLLKSAGLALILLVAITVALVRASAWLVAAAGTWGERMLGGGAHWPVTVLEWMLGVAASLGVVAAAVFLMPAVTALVASFFADEIAEAVERRHYPLDPPGQAPPAGSAMWEGVKAAGLSVLVYLCALPFLLFGGVGAVLIFVATAYLLSREYFELAAMRFRPAAEARALRRQNSGTVFMAGLLIAALVSVPIVNLTAPLFSAALMVHLHKRLTRSLPARR